MGMKTTIQLMEWNHSPRQRKSSRLHSQIFHFFCKEIPYLFISALRFARITVIIYFYSIQIKIINNFNFSFHKNKLFLSFHSNQMVWAGPRPFDGSERATRLRRTQPIQLLSSFLTALQRADKKKRKLMSLPRQRLEPRLQLLAFFDS